MGQYCWGLLQVGSSLTSLVENNRQFKDVRLKVSNKSIISFNGKNVDHLLQNIPEPGLSYLDLSKGAESVHQFAVNPNTFKFSLE